MKVTLIIPVYNAERTIELCLEYIFNQQRQADQILLIDNSSTDNSIKKIQDFMQNHKNMNITLLHESKKGPAAARNRGLPYATGDIIAFTDADCFPRKDWLKNTMHMYEENDIDGIGGITYIYNPRTSSEKLQAIDIVILEEFQAKIIFQKHEILFGKSVVTNNASYRREVFEKIDGFDETLSITGEDADLTTRAFIKGFRIIVWHPELVVWHMPRRNFLLYAKRIFQYRMVLPILFKKHFKKETLIYIPIFGIKKLPFFSTLLFTKEFEILMFFLLLIFFFYKLFPIVSLGIITILFIRSFTGILMRKRFVDAKISFFEALKIVVLDIIKKTVSEYGRIYGSVKNRSIYL